MAHEISIVNGVAEAAYAIKPAWHGHGAVLSNAMSAEEAYNAAHLTWGVKKSDILYADPSVEGMELRTHPIKCLTTRSDNGDVLGEVSRKYQVIQNKDQFDFFAGLFDEHEVVFESAFALKGGQYVCLLARIPGHVLTLGDNDTSEPYLMSLNSHNGLLTHRIYPTGVRAVCWNTVTLAMQMASTYIGVRHFGNIEESMKMAKRAVQTTLGYWDDYCENAKRLADIAVDHEQARRYIEHVFPGNADEESVTSHLTNTRSRILDMWQSERQRLSGIESTAWSLLQAVTEYVDHESRSKGRDEGDRRMSMVYNAYVGSGSTRKAKAVNLANAMFIEPNHKEVVTT